MASSPSLRLLNESKLISQGAEAKVYKGYISPESGPVVFKHRFKKQYRHPTLDATLTKARVAGEARALLKCLRSGVKVPGIRMLDASEGLLGIEWVDGRAVKYLLPGGAEGDDEDHKDAPTEELGSAEFLQREYGVSVSQLMELIGQEIAQMHLADVVHGDLTTSNMMLRRRGTFTATDTATPTELVLIDFGLAYQSTLVEDKAVDLYVLERAFASTHPDAEPLFASVLDAYSRRLGKEWAPLKRRLDEVRLRGRKRDMTG